MNKSTPLREPEHLKKCAIEFFKHCGTILDYIKAGKEVPDELQREFDLLVERGGECPILFYSDTFHKVISEERKLLGLDEYVPLHVLEAAAKKLGMKLVPKQN
jgi:hypothetical protein